MHTQVGDKIIVVLIETLLGSLRKVLLASLAVLPPSYLTARTWIPSSPYPAVGGQGKKLVPETCNAPSVVACDPSEHPQPRP